MTATIRAPKLRPMTAQSLLASGGVDDQAHDEGHEQDGDEGEQAEHGGSPSASSSGKLDFVYDESHCMWYWMIAQWIDVTVDVKVATNPR